MTNLEYIESRRLELVRMAKAVLNDEIGIILGSRIIQSFRFELANDFDHDFLAFVAVDSDTDHLPVDAERNNWSAEALTRKGIEIADAESFHRDAVITACHRIIQRFELRASTES